MDFTEFEQAALEAIIPQLRADGFKGSRTNMRRLAPPIIQAVSIGGSVRHREILFFTLGAHLAFLPPCGRLGVTKEPSKYSVVDCDPDWRFAINPPGSLGGWPLPKSSEEAIQTTGAMVDAWKQAGRHWFESFGQWPNAWLAVAQNTLEQRPHCQRAYKAAQIAVHAGDSRLAARIVEHGLADPRIDAFWREELGSVGKEPGRA